MGKRVVDAGFQEPQSIVSVNEITSRPWNKRPKVKEKENATPTHTKKKRNECKEKRRRTK